MQPITHVSLAPTEDHIRHLRAEQEFCGAIGCCGLIALKTLVKLVCWAANAIIPGERSVAFGPKERHQGDR